MASTFEPFAFASPDGRWVLVAIEAVARRDIP
jgi:hypothetical protein